MDLFGAGDRITARVTTWDDVILGEHRSSWKEFRLGRRAFGHLRGNSLVDILLPKSERIRLVHAGEVEPHAVLPTSGWVTIYLHHPRDEQRALKILRMAYDIVKQQERFRRQTRISELTTTRPT